MFKKLLILGFIFLCVIGIAYTHDYLQNSLSAASAVKGGNVTGRIGTAGSLPDGTSGGMEKGDIVTFSSTTSNGTPLTWRLVANSLSNRHNPGSVVVNTSNDYGYDVIASAPVTYGNNVWHCVTELLDPMPYMPQSFTSYRRKNNLIKDEIKKINDKVAANVIENSLIKDRLVFNVLNIDTNLKSGGQNYIDYQELRIFEFNAFYEMGSYLEDRFTLGSLNLPGSDFSLPSSKCSGTFWAGIIYGDGSMKNSHEFPCAINESAATSLYGPRNFSESLPYRLGVFLDLEQVVFAVSDHQQIIQKDAYYDVTQPAVTTMEDSSGDAMKLRLLDTSKVVDFQDILDNKGDSIYTSQGLSKTDVAKVGENSTIRLKVNANAGSDAEGVHTVSALIFDQSNNFIKYAPLATANGLKEYEINVGDFNLLKGKTYAIQVVNERYTGASAGITTSSSMSDPLKIEVVESHKVTYTKDPQIGASTGKDYEYQMNVNAGQKIGYVTLQPLGIPPIYYQITSYDGVDTSYENFEIPNLRSDFTSTDTTLDIKIKQNAKDLTNGSLNSGDYKFCIEASSLISFSKTCTVFTVEKLEPKIAFDDPNLTKKSIAQASAGWSETATATPNTNVKVTYAKTGGSIGLIDINQDTGKISYTGGNAYGKVTIKATADDDPANGKDNYQPKEATKEILLYREVAAHITPHVNSSDKSVPTFSTSDANIKPNGVVGNVIGTLGTPDDASSGSTTYSYEIKNIDDYNYFSINPITGEITTTADLSTSTGTYHITVKVSDRWSSIDLPISIHVGKAPAENLKFYENSTSNTMISTKSVNMTDTNVSVFATVKGSSNTNPVTYRIKDGSTNVIEVNTNSGAITIHGVGTVVIVAEKQGISGQADAITELTFTVTAGSQQFIYTDASGNELSKTQDKYNAYEEVYGKGKTFQLYTTGNPQGSIVTYALKAGSPTDVISVDSNGQVSILNASLNTQMGKVIVEATSYDPSGNYTDKTIELPINIKKAEQTISFADVTYAISGSGTVTPIINAQDLSSNEGGATVNDTSYYITVDTSIASGIAWTNDGINIEYNYSGNDGLDIPLHVEKQGNRNYNKATANGQMRIMGLDESSLAITVPGKIVYGDHFTLRSLQDDSFSTNVQYQFEVDNTTYISNPIVNGNQAEFDALKYSGNTMIKIKVTRTADGEIPLSKTVSVKVLPKDINIVIDDQTKLKGEQNPTFTYQDFNHQLVSWNGVKNSILPGDIQLSTTAKDTSPTGDYPITGNTNTLNTKYPNYNFTFTDGTLTITDEAVDDAWYHLELDDGNNTPYNGNWTNQDVNIVSDHQDYTELSDNQNSWNHNQVTISKEGSYNQSFWMKKSSTGAITKEKQTKIQIDKQAPKIKSIVGSNGKRSRSQTFKPGMVVTIQAEDTALDPNTQISGVSKTTYEIIKLDEQGKPTGTPNKVDQNDDTVEVSLKETGTYEICATATDHASNESEETCERVTIRSWGESSDGKELPDINIDIDGDGIPDINITRPGEKKPYLNIDTNGDGIPDINISKDGEEVILGVTKPYLNIMDPKVPWNPTQEIDYDGDGEPDFRTDPNLSAILSIDSNNDRIPDLNIDLDGDYIADVNINVNGDKKAPQTNIDTDGDGKPDINIDLDGDGKPDTMISTNIEWKPTYMVKDEKGNVIYGTTLNIKPDEKDSITDQGIVVRPSDPNVKFYDNTELKVIDITKQTESEHSNILTTVTKGKVEKVYEIQMLVNGKETEPEGKIEVSIPCDTEQKVHLMKKNKDGTWTEISYERKGNYLVFITDTLGSYSIVTETSNTSVQGTYTPNVGGANTGYRPIFSSYLFYFLISFIVLCLLLKKHQQNKNDCA